MNNADIARMLSHIAVYMEINEEMVFKIRAYEKAAQVIGSLTEDLSDIYKKGGIKALEEIPGVGKGIAEKIEEMIKTGKLQWYEELKKNMPVDLEGMLRIEGLGPKKILALYRKLKIKNVEELEKAAVEGKIRDLEGFGEKSEQNILKGIQFLKAGGNRFLLGYISPLAKTIESRLKAVPGVENVVIAGSFRRKKETVGDLDILVISKENGKVMDFFVSMPEVQSVIGKGKTKSSVKLSSGINVDLRVVEEKSYGAALNYFTGSKDHNVALRRIAIEKGCKLSEYGLFRNEKMIAGKTEEELYKALGLPYIEPELREMAGELEAARKGILPHLVGYNDLKGDLQVQTSWTDGNHSIEEMARAAQKINLQYIAITDHTKYLAFTGGLNEKKVLRQMAEIDAINEKLKKEGLKFTILKGTECDIHKDGSLDLQDSTLERLDVVGASVHSYFKLPRSEQTERLKKAMQNPHVDIMFHPTGREIQKREPIDLDMDDIIKTAKDTRTALEINAFPDRLDLKDEHIKMAIKAGVKLCINSDAHHTSHFRFLEFGIAQARRGWAEKKDIINTLPLRDFQKALK